MHRLLSNTRILILSFACLGVMTLAFMPATTYAEDGTDICTNTSQRCNHFVETYINPFIYLLSALVGIVAVISIIVAGIQYASSADDPGAVTKAKTRIFNTVIGLFAYIFLFAFLEYLVPGGIF